MRILEHLEPKSVFHFFEDLCAIPHGSENTKAISDYCVSFAKERGLQVRQDEWNNVVLVKEAAPGYENAETILLQGHLDMVCEKTPDCPLDMEKDGLDLAVDGDQILARGTTLGGDDGIAVAIALAVLDDKDLPHPRLEVLLTVDEEIGMLGAIGLDLSDLRGRKLLNIDSEVEGVLTVSCAGGITVNSCLPFTRAAYRGRRCTVTVGGGMGGHSGTEIGKGRANANQLMGQVLDRMCAKTELRLVAVNGGLKYNAIAREATAVVLVRDAAAALTVAEELTKAWKKAYGAFETELFVRVTAENEEEAQAMDETGTERVISLLHLAPFGVVDMSGDIPGLVQTSLNLGILTTEETQLRATFLLRSSLASQKYLVVSRLERLTRLLGGCVEKDSDYPAWEYCKDSSLRTLMEEVFRDQYGHAPRVEAIHAGLECGIFCGKRPELDCVSFGPDLPNIHTPRERLGISSTQRVWEFTKEVLRRSK